MFEIQIEPNLALRLLMKTDADELFHLVDESRDHLSLWLPWVSKMQSVADYHQLLPVWLAEFAASKSLHVGILYQDQLAGVIGFHSFDHTNQKTTIGYWLGKNFEGRGIMTTATKKMLSLAFTQYDMNRVEICCAVKNQRSRNIPERLGFREEGVLHVYEKMGEQFLDHAVYSLTKSEWMTGHCTDTQSI